MSEFTGMYDKNGKKVMDGSLIKIPSKINTTGHGAYTLQRVSKHHGIWLTSYYTSENGKLLPEGYLIGSLLNNYNCNYIDMFESEEYRPETDIEVIEDVTPEQTLQQRFKEVVRIANEADSKSPERVYNNGYWKGMKEAAAILGMKLELDENKI